MNREKKSCDRILLLLVLLIDRLLHHFSMIFYNISLFLNTNLLSNIYYNGHIYGNWGMCEEHTGEVLKCLW